MAGNWTKLTATGKTKNLDDIVAVMSMLDNGLMIEDYSDFSFSGMYGNLAEYTSFIKERFELLGIKAELTADGMNEDEWAESWKKYYNPIPLGRVTIVPAWQEYTPGEDEIIIRMDPGMAFGTGTHETTRLVMKIMQDEIRGGERVLDVGTGSGILSICASKLGAKSCNAYDIDPVAVKVARDNAIADGCDNITVGVSDLLHGVDISQGKYDFCVANIVADIIIRMMPDIAKFITHDAPLILSGIISMRADEVRRAVTENGFVVVREEQENDWLAIMVRQK